MRHFHQPLRQKKRDGRQAIHDDDRRPEHRDLFRILLYEREVTRAQAQRYRAPRYRRLVAWVTSVVADGIAAGVFRDVSPEKAAAMFVESNFALMSQRLLSSETAPVEEDARLISDLFLRGIRRGR